MNRGDNMGIVDEIATYVTLRVKNVVATNTRGDNIVSHDDYQIFARVDIMDGSETEVESGTLAIGDAIAFFNPDDISYIKRGNYFQHDGKWYVINNVIHEKIGDILVFIEARARQFVDSDAIFNVSRSITSNAKIA